MNEVGKKSPDVNADFEEFYNEESEKQEQREARLIQDMENYREWYHKAVTENIELNAKIEMLEKVVKSQAAYITSVQK